MNQKRKGQDEPTKIHKLTIPIFARDYDPHDFYSLRPPPKGLKEKNSSCKGHVTEVTVTLVVII